MMKWPVLPVTLVSVSTLVGSPAFAQASDHYWAYELDFPYTSGQSAIVQDQFLPEPLGIGVIDMQFILTPALQDGGSYMDPTAHLTWWNITPPVPINQAITAVDKFGQGEWTLTDLAFLLTPARKNAPPGTPLPDNINHFLCYNAVGPQVSQTVTLEDQFHPVPETVFVTRGFYYCAPCVKEHLGATYPIVDPDVYLGVYEILPQPIPFTVSSIADQFIQQPTTPVRTSIWLFVPSIKGGSVPTERSTWGRLKSYYD